MTSRTSLPLLLAAPFLVAACGGSSSSSHHGTPCDTGQLSACSQQMLTNAAVDDVLFLLVHGQFLHQFQYSQSFFTKLDETFQCDRGSVVQTREGDYTRIEFNACGMDEDGDDESITLNGTVRYRAPTLDQPGALHYQQVEMSGSEHRWQLDGDDTLAPLDADGSRRTALSLTYRLTEDGVDHDYRADTAYDFHGLDTPDDEHDDWTGDFDVQRYDDAGQVTRHFRYDLLDAYSILRLDNVDRVDVTDNLDRSWHYHFNPPGAVQRCVKDGVAALLGQFSVSDSAGNQLTVSASQCGLYESTVIPAGEPL